MSAIQPILGPNGRPLRSQSLADSGRAVRGRYDAAQSNSDNRRLWADADGLSARAANSPEVRRILRNRCRYEKVNNPHLEGIVQTLANDTIGTGPRLQLLTESDETNRLVEREFALWAEAVSLAEKLRTLRMARVVDGEAFVFLAPNPKLPTDVQLDLRLIEADQIETPDLFYPTTQAVSGIVFDRWDNPVEYHLLRTHPGDTIWQAAPWTYDRVPADLVIHYFRRDRAGQCRGVPEITSAIADFSELRRYSKAVLAAAETAADFAAMLYTDVPLDADAIDVGNGFETLEISRRMMTTLPAGYKAMQLKAEQPTTTYPDYERQKINSFARCLNMPRNVALGDSSNYNYASGRLDHQTYYKSLRVDQSQLKLVVLDRVLRAFLAEALPVLGLGRVSDFRPADWPHQWFFDGQEHVDPEKEANAQATRLSNRTTTYAEEFARQGRDWEQAFAQMAKEQQRLKELGLLPQPAPTQSPPQSRPGSKPATPSDENMNEEETDDAGTTED